MVNIISAIQQFFSPVKHLPSGIYHGQSGTNRYHLRLEEDGHGFLILNASTVLHLNETAAEYAYYLLHDEPADNVSQEISRRYRISPGQAKEDFLSFQEKIFSLLETPDLDPVTFLDIEREEPYSGAITAPYRLDCALTYRLPQGHNPSLAPTRRVDRELTTEEWKIIINKAWEAGIPHLIFTGGEPTLRDDLLDIILHAEKNGQVTGLLSDGILLDNRSFLDDLLQTGLDHLMIALDPDHPRAWKALELILPEDLYTTVHITISPEMIDRVSDYLQKISIMGANAISLSISDRENPSLQSALTAAQDLAAELGLPLKWDLPVPYSTHNPVQLELENADVELPARAGTAWCYVEPDGDVLPGQGIDKVFGNFLTDSWEEIWGEGQEG